MSLRIKNWSRHQHFKDRTPPWIKLYREILDDPDWHDLDGPSAKILISLWLIASEDDTHEGRLPDSRRLAFRLRIKEEQLKQELAKLSEWLICDDISAISDQYRRDAPETETETETETYKPETETTPAKQARFDPLKINLPETIPIDTWRDWISYRRKRRLSTTEDSVKEQIVFLDECAAKGFVVSEIIRTSIRQNWQGLFEPKHKPILSGAGSIEARNKANVVDWTPQELRETA